MLFDKDGTLIDSHCYWGAIIQARSKALIRELKLPEAWHEALCGRMGYSLKTQRLLEAGPIALVSREEVIRLMQEFLSQRSVQGSSEERIADIFLTVHKELSGNTKAVKLLPGVTQLLTRLKEAKVRMAVVTTDALKNTTEILGYLGLVDFFEEVVAKESTKEPKESGAPATLAVQKLKVKPQETVCIGDAPMDILMAKRSGMKAAIAVATGQISSQELRSHSPYLVGNLEQIAVEG